MSQLPDRPSLEFLKKRAKDRLADLRRINPLAKLADALLAVAREHGFPRWRALKAEIDRRLAGHVTAFFEACAKGDIATLRTMLAADATLARAVAVDRNYGGWTALHEAARYGPADVVRLLLAHGADPNAREEGDNTYPLHWAAARGDFAVMGALLDAGGDVHGFGADHAGDVIGWGTFFTEPGKDVRAVADFLIARGARHSIFSALSVGDPDLVRAVIEENPDALEHRMSKFEQGVTPLHLAIQRKRDDLVDVLLELGADLEAEDLHGQTPLVRALAHGTQRAADRLRAAGAKPPKTIAPTELKDGVAKLAGSVTKIIPMILVPDVAATLDWYVSIGFTELGRVGDDGRVNWGIVRFGDAEIMLSVNGTKGQQHVSLWLYTDKVDALYQLFKARQLADPNEVEVSQDIYDPFYGGREFGIRDVNGYELYFRRG
ncbi:MAG: ankyrin repeat domain-containing protein [Vicinamibacteraceae bacterium]